MKENWYQKHLADQNLRQPLEKIENEIAQKAHEGRCLHCGEKLHRGNSKSHRSSDGAMEFRKPMEIASIQWKRVA